MRQQGGDRALRQLVAKLASADAGDVEQVLETLDPAHRGKVRSLLADYLGPGVFTEAAPAEAAPEPVEDLSHLAGFSPWVGERLSLAEGRTPDGNHAPDFKMTPAALGALSQAARALPAEPPLMVSLLQAEPRRSANPFRRWAARRSPAP
jgi:hypothetical protein